MEPWTIDRTQDGVVGLAFADRLEPALRLSVVKMGPSLEEGRCWVRWLLNMKDGMSMKSQA